MVAGEGMRAVAGIVGIAIIGLGLVVVGDWLERHWREIAAAPLDERDLSAEALVPEYAAAIGACRCDACRKLGRVKSPCSDFDGD